MRLAFTGDDGVGKTMLAKLFAEHAKCKVQSFARALRDELSFVYPVLDIFAKPTLPWVRHLMLGHGAYKRSIDLDYWVKLLVLDDNFVVDDVRYGNEAEMLFGKDCKLIYVGKACNKHDLGILQLLADEYIVALPNATEIKSLANELDIDIDIMAIVKFMNKHTSAHQSENIIDS